MISLRLPEDIEIKLNEISQIEKTSKSSIIKKALDRYIKDFEKKTTPYNLGKDLFGKYGNGDKNSSKNYKSELKGKLREKHSHWRRSHNRSF